MSSRRAILIIVCLGLWLLGAGYAAAAEIFGDYEFRDKVGRRTLTVSKWQQPGAVMFKISMELESDNRWVGMSGVADLKGNTATYVDKDKECPLTITFKGNQAVVKAPNCRDRLGPLPLEGTYRKK